MTPFSLAAQSTRTQTRVNASTGGKGAFLSVAMKKKVFVPSTMVALSCLYSSFSHFRSSFSTATTSPRRNKPSVGLTDSVVVAVAALSCLVSILVFPFLVSLGGT